MITNESLTIGAISAGATVLVHEYLHANESLASDIPNLTGSTVANVGSVSVGLAVAVLAGVVFNYYYWEEISE